MIHDTVAPQPVIDAKRLTLRPIQKSDAGLIAMYASDERIARGSRAIAHPLAPGTVEAMIDRAQLPDRTEDIWVMDGSAHDHAEAIGIISLNRMDRAQSELFFWVAPAFWNTGFASEAVGAMMEANPHAAKRYFAEMFQDNPGSARVLTNCGFDYLGDAEAFSVARGATVPTWTYTLKTGL